MAKPHTIDGQLQGEYKTLLAASPYWGTRLYHRLVIDEQNAWFSEFVVELGEQKIKHQQLSSAIRDYERIRLNS